MKKMKRGSAILFALFVTAFLLGVTITVWPMTFMAITIVKCILLTSVGVATVATILDIDKWLGDNPRKIDYNEADHYGPLSFLYKNYAVGTNPVKIGRWVLGAILFAVLFCISQWVYDGYKQTAFVYNTSTVIHNQYNKKAFERAGFYDKMWKTYSEKKEIMFLNKDAFVQVVQITMNNRKAGEQVMWNWVQENQPVPYEQFTKLYADLSDFITDQRKQYLKLETDCQDLANSNNILLDTFPNNLYNKILGCKKIEFEYGFTSDSTQKIFKDKKENIK